VLSDSDVGKQVLYRDFYMSGWGMKVFLKICMEAILVHIIQEWVELRHRT
jgi:hypothetical protein